MTLKEAKKELNQLVKSFENADYVSMTELEHAIILTKRILEMGGKP